MGAVRYVHGWEEQIEFNLLATEIKAINCFNLYSNREIKESGWIPENAKVIFRKGWECIDCLALHDKKSDAKKCCIVDYPQETDPSGTYDVIGKSNKKKKQFVFQEIEEK